MAQDYREIYQELLENVDMGFSSAFPRGYPTIVDDLLRDAGIDVLGTDSIKVSQSALLIYFAQKINDLEKQIADLSQCVAHPLVSIEQETKR